MDVEAHTTHFLLTKHTLLGCPLEASYHRVLDLIKVLYSLSAIHHNVRAGALRAKAPDLPGLGYIVVILVCKIASTLLRLLFGIYITLVDVLGQLLRHWLCLHKQSVVFVWGLGQTHPVRFLSHGFS